MIASEDALSKRGMWNFSALGHGVGGQRPEQLRGAYSDMRKATGACAGNGSPL